jgi:protocatechuate 3,4-dioxygenase beta subunit
VARRSLLVVLAVAAALVGTVDVDAAGSCRPTPTDAFGPFGSGLPPLRAKTGTGHVLTGVVLGAPDCRPVRRAQVQLWQSNRRGQYTRALSATVLTDAAGRFRYESPTPSGREPHIHIRVVAEGFRPLLTRYVAGVGAHRGSVRLVLEPEDL